MGRQKREHVTASTVHDIHKIVHCAFNLAVKWDYISTNPFIKATLPEHKEKERKVLEPEQVLKVLDFTCRKEYYDYYLMHCAIHLAIACTMRGGEIGALQWDRVDMVKQRVSIDRVIDRIGKENAKLPKMQILFTFPNLYPGTKTSIYLEKGLCEKKCQRAHISCAVSIHNQSCFCRSRMVVHTLSVMSPRSRCG